LAKNQQHPEKLSRCTAV